MKLLFEIKNRWTGKVIFSLEKDNNSLKETIKEYIKKELESGKTRADLTRANLTDADLIGANLIGANLTDADLTRANLTGADLIGADLTRADLIGANLTRANLTRTNLTDADLIGANLTDADLTDADLTRANLTRANLTGADLTRANLDQFKNDLWAKLLKVKKEIPAFKEKMKEGKIKGTCYEGECCCFVGTIANIQHKPYKDIAIKPDSASPIERWFLQFKEGQTPENSHAMKITYEWIEELETLIP